MPVNNRICVGPPLIKSEELLALIRSGIINILYNVKYKYEKNKFTLQDEFGNKYIVDRFIKAKVGSSNFEENGFYNEVIKSGLATRFKKGNIIADGFAISKDFQSIDINGNVVKNLFFLGLPTEGIKFYTFILPRPFVKSTFLTDSNTAVQTCLNNIIAGEK